MCIDILERGGNCPLLTYRTLLYHRNFYELRLTRSIKDLAQPSAHPKVAEVAAQLAVQHALSSGIGESLNQARDSLLGF